MKGLGHAILTGRPLIGDEPFAVVLADDLCVNPEGDGVLTQMVKLYNQFRCSIIAIQEVDPQETNKYGVIAGDMIRDDIFRVTNMVEKPAPEDAPSNLAIIGRYILTPDIFDIIKNTEPGKGGEIQITDALMQQAQNGCVIAYKFKGQALRLRWRRGLHRRDQLLLRLARLTDTPLLGSNIAMTGRRAFAGSEPRTPLACLMGAGLLHEAAKRPQCDAGRLLGENTWPTILICS